MKCKIESCLKDALSKGFCNPHYQSWYRYGDPLKSARKADLARKQCIVEGCTKLHKSRGYCDKHYFQLRVHGNAERYSVFSPNTYRIEDGIVYMDLRDRSGQVVAVATFDERHLAKVLQYKWRPSNRSRKSIYVAGVRGQEFTMLHRVIMDATDGEEIDHRNRDPLDNTDANLRKCSRSDNMRNTRFAIGQSGYIGVQVDHRKAIKKYYARVNVDDAPVMIGYFEDPAEAAYVRDQMAMQLHGEFAVLNFEY